MKAVQGEWDFLKSEGAITNSSHEKTNGRHLTKLLWLHKELSKKLRKKNMYKKWKGVQLRDEPYISVACTCRDGVRNIKPQNERRFVRDVKRCCFLPCPTKEEVKVTLSYGKDG